MQKTTERKKKKIAPIVVTALVILYIVPLLLMALAMMREAGQVSVSLAMPLLCYLVLGGAVIVGILKALRQRLEEIDGGEEEDASQY